MIKHLGSSIMGLSLINIADQNISYQGDQKIGRASVEQEDIMYLCEMYVNKAYTYLVLTTQDLLG